MAVPDIRILKADDIVSAKCNEFTHKTAYKSSLPASFSGRLSFQYIFSDDCHSQNTT